MRLYTIGTTQTSAEAFFRCLREAGVKRILDVRLHGTGQLAGFAKRGDLAYFARELLGAPLEHAEEVTPTEQLLDDWRSKRIDWPAYEARFRRLLAQRKVERTLTPKRVDGAVLLCREHGAQRCHRRLVAEYLMKKVPGLEVVHLVPKDGR